MPDRAAGHDEVLDVVPPDKDEFAALIDRCHLDHAKSAIARPQEAMCAGPPEEGIPEARRWRP